MLQLGNIIGGETLNFKFATSVNGVPTTLSGSPVIKAYKTDATGTEVTTGITLTADFDSMTGCNHVKVVTTDAFYTAGDYELVITTGTVGGVSVVGKPVGHFSILNRKVVLADGVLHGGTGASLELGGSGTSSGVPLQVSGTGTAALFAASGSGHGLSLIGSGIGSGLRLSGGILGSGLQSNGGSSGGNGATLTGGAGGGHGLELNAIGTSKHGLQATGGTSGHGMSLIAGSGGNALRLGSFTLDMLAALMAASESGTAQGGAASTITLRSGASGTDDYYDEQAVVIYGGTGAGQVRVISGYVGSTKVATVSEAWATNPDNTSTYILIGRIE